MNKNLFCGYKRATKLTNKINNSCLYIQKTYKTYKGESTNNKNKKIIQKFEQKKLPDSLYNQKIKSNKIRTKYPTNNINKTRIIKLEVLN